MANTEVSAAFSSLGRLGGQATQSQMTPEERRAASLELNNIRWKKRREEKAKLAAEMEANKAKAAARAAKA